MPNPHACFHNNNLHRAPTHTLARTLHHAIQAGEPIGVMMGVLREQHHFEENLTSESLAHAFCTEFTDSNLPDHYKDAEGPRLLLDASEYANETRFLNDPTWVNPRYACVCVHVCMGIIAYAVNIPGHCDACARVGRTLTYVCKDLNTCARHACIYIKHPHPLHRTHGPSQTHPHTNSADSADNGGTIMPNVEMRVAWHFEFKRPYIVLCLLCAVEPMTELLVDWSSISWSCMSRVALTNLGLEAQFYHRRLAALQHCMRENGMDVERYADGCLYVSTYINLHVHGLRED